MADAAHGFDVRSSLPRPWEEESSFNDALYEWMGRAPWLALSALAHVIVFLVLWAIPWELLNPEPDRFIQASFQPTVVDDFVEPLPEEQVELAEEEELEEPQVLPVDPRPATPDTAADSVGDPDFLSSPSLDRPPDHGLPLFGVGGGPQGHFGPRGPRGGGGRKGGGRGTEQALVDGLEWLKAHQSPDGSWDSDGFDSNCGTISAASTCDGPGQSANDVGMTGLALLAFLGDGNTTTTGVYKETVQSGIKWLKQQQDPDTGLLGEKIGHAYVYNHAIATLAMCEAYYSTKSPLQKKATQRAVNYITTARNPYGAWRYDVPPSGDNDTSITGWMVFALKSAEEAGLAVDDDAYAGALSWIDEVTDTSNGRVGYDSQGSASSRIERKNDHYPTDKGEAMTAVGLLSRVFMGQTPEAYPIMTKHADLLLRKLPEWDPDGMGCDMYYWYYGSYALYQMGGSHWTSWQKAMEKAVVGSQRRDGDEQGSWDPIGPWGFSGGRVYSTALMTLCLEVYFRYAKVLGAR